MARKPTLRVATEADAPVKPLTLSEAVESGTYLQILVAQRRQMIADLGEAKGPALAALHRQVALHSKEISMLQTQADAEAKSVEEQQQRHVASDSTYDPEAI